MVPLAAARNKFGAAALLSGFVMVECMVLILNRGRCPLTDIAERFSTDRSPNFDIFLPPWLAKYNKIIFGTLFVAGELFAIIRWIKA